MEQPALDSRGVEGSARNYYIHRNRSSGRGLISLLLALVPIGLFWSLSYMSTSNGDAVGSVVFFFMGIFFGAVVASAVRINSQWEQAIVLRFGKYKKTTGPGIFFVIPFVDSVISDDMRIRTLNIPAQEVITKDNISIVVNAIVLMKISDIQKAIINIEDYASSVVKVSNTTLRDVIGQENLNTILTGTSDIGTKIKNIIDKTVQDWGIDVSGIEMQNIELPENMKRALAIQAEAERGAKAVVIKADAELKASEVLKRAGANMNDPNAMQLRVLETVSEASKEQANTIIMALPLETLRALGPGGIGALASINSSDARKRVIGGKVRYVGAEK